MKESTYQVGPNQVVKRNSSTEAAGTESGSGV